MVATSDCRYYGRWIGNTRPEQSVGRLFARAKTASNALSHSYSYSYSDSYVYANIHSYLYANSNGNIYTNSYCYIHAHPNSHCNGNGYPDANTYSYGMSAKLDSNFTDRHRAGSEFSSVHF